MTDISVESQPQTIVVNSAYNNNVRVLSQTQRLVVNPATSSVSITNAGPPGPAGPEGFSDVESVLTTDGDILTKNAGILARITRINLALDTAFTSKYAPIAQALTVDGNVSTRVAGAPGEITRANLANDSAFVSKFAPISQNLTVNGNLSTRAGGVPSEITRAALAADAAFSGVYSPVSLGLTVNGNIPTRAAGATTEITRANLANDTAFTSKYAPIAQALTVDGNVSTRVGGAPSEITRANLAADSAFTGKFFIQTVATSAPGSPTVGDRWLDTTSGKVRMKIYTSTGWKIIGGDMPTVEVRTSQAWTLGTSGTAGEPIWDTEEDDVDGFHDQTNGTTQRYITIPTGLGGLYIASYEVVADSDTTAYMRSAWMDINVASATIPNASSGRRYGGVSINPSTATGALMLAGTSRLKLAAGDVVRVKTLQNSGGSRAWGAGGTQQSLSHFNLTMVSHVP